MSLLKRKNTKYYIIIFTSRFYESLLRALFCEHLFCCRRRFFSEVLGNTLKPVSYTHLRPHETVLDLVCLLRLEKKKKPWPQSKDHHTFQALPPLCTTVCRSGRHLVRPLQWKMTKSDDQWPTIRAQVTPKQTTSWSCPATGDSHPQHTWPWTNAEHAQKAARSLYSNNPKKNSKFSPIGT